MNGDVSHEVADRLALLMEKVGSDRWDELTDRLMAGTIRDLDPKLNLSKMNKATAIKVFEAGRDAYNHDEEIIRFRRILHEEIRKAGSAIVRAERAMGDLDGMGDVEYEGGCDDVAKFLKDALRMLRAAQAIKPSDADGETR